MLDVAENNLNKGQVKAYRGRPHIQNNLKIHKINDAATNGISTLVIATLFTQFFLWQTTSAAVLTLEELDFLKRERAEAAIKWAPLVWLHPEERFFPTSVHTFLKHVAVRNVPASQRLPEAPVLVSMSRSLNTVVNLPEGPASKDTYLIAPMDPGCRNCPLPRFLHGTKPTRNYTPAVYAIVTSCLPSKKPQRPKRKPHIRARFPARLSRRARFKHRKDPGYIRSSRHIQASHYNENEACDSYEVKQEAKKVWSNNPYKYIDSTEDTLSFTANDIHSTLPVFSEEDNLIPSPSSTLLPPKPTQDQTGTTLELDYTTTEQPQQDTSFVDEETTTTYPTTVYPESKEITPALSIELEDAESSENDENYRPTRNPEIISLFNSFSNTESKRPAHLKGHRFTVTYWMFYPFSQGKRVCTRRLWLLGRVFKPRIRSKCYGEVVTLNSHVGDWEHISIFFEDGVPQRMYVSTHTYGAFYHYDRHSNVYLYHGKDTRLGLPLSPKYPPIVRMKGSHPILYAALGSHGLWGSPGNQRYEKFVPLEDKTSAGTRWDTWKNLDIIDYRSPDLDRPDRQWLQFNGRWGNPSTGCHRALFGSCDLANGPTGIPLKRANFPCYLPRHSTFHPKS